MAVRRNYRINLRNYGNPPAIMVSQYDENYDLVFEVYDGVVPATGLNVYTVKLVGRQPGDDPALKYEFTGTVSGIANNILSFTIDTTMTGRAGKGTAEIVILDTTNDVKFASFNLPVYVEKAAVPDDAIDADVERAQEIADEVQDIVDTAAAEVKGEAESWAVGERDGEPVPSTDPTYHNNAKYYAEQAQDIADSIGIDATLSISGKAADAKKTGDEISSLKEDLSHISDNENLFDSSTIESNKRLDSAGRTTSGDGFYTSDFIPVIAGQYYSKNSPVIDTYHRIAVYGSDKVMLTDQLFTDNIVQIADGGVYIRICGLSTEVSTAEVKHLTADDNIARTDSSKALSILDNIANFGNLFNASTIESNKRLDSAGMTTPSDGYFTSAFIPVSEGYTITKNSPVENAYHRIAVYSEANGLSLIEGQVFNDNVITVAKGGKYVRICGLSTEVSTTTVVVNSAIDESARFLANVALNNIDSLDAEQTKSMLGSDGVTEYSASLSGGSSVTITTFPSYLKKNTFVSFYGKFLSFSGLLIGKGYNTYRGDWIEVTPTSVIFHHYEENTDNVMQTDTHGITISDYIMVMMYLDADGKMNCSINSTGGTFSTYRQTNYDVFSGNTFATPTATMTDVELCVSNGDTKKPVWCIGDSYFGVNDQRVVGQLKNLGFWDGVLFDGLAGLNSQNAYAELNKLLSFGLPKMLVWYLGMNDNNASYLEYMNLVKAICEDNGITLILNKVPSVPNLEKETISGYVEASGCRYVNSYLAVGSSVGGAWYTGFLSSDNVHPTALGAKALAMRMLVDVPELAEYGFKL